MVVSETNIHSIPFIIRNFIILFNNVSLTTICHISPLCHSFIAALQLGLLDCHNSTNAGTNLYLL